jgi:hypothetical protein
MKLADAFAQVHPAIDATATALQAMKDAVPGLLSSVDTAYSALQSVVAREKAAIQSRIDAETAAVTKLKSLSDSLHGTLDSMHGPGQEAFERAAAQAQIKSAVAIAQAGGPLPDADSIKKALGIVTQDASSQFATYQDYQRDFYTTQNDISSLAGLTDDKLSVEQKSLDALNAQMKQLDDVLASEQAQIDILKGIDTTGLSIVQAVEGVRTAILAAQANPLAAAPGAINQAYQSALGRAPDSAGLDYWQQQAANGTPIGDIVGAIKNSPEAQVQGLYHDLLGRGADAGGLDYFLHSGGSIDAIKAAIMSSDEYKHLHGVPGFASGGYFGGGLRIVGERGPEIEATGQSRIWSSEQTSAILSRAANPQASGDVLAGEVRRLAAALEEQQKESAVLRVILTDALRAIAGHTADTSGHLDDIVNGKKPISTVEAS